MGGDLAAPYDRSDISLSKSVKQVSPAQGPASLPYRALEHPSVSLWRISEISKGMIFPKRILGHDPHNSRKKIDG